MKLKNILATCLLFCITQLSANPIPSSVPMIDLRDYFNIYKKSELLKTVHHALKEVGFFAVLNPNVNELALQKGYLTAQNYFSQPLDAKLQENIPTSNGQRGYVQSEIAQHQTQKDFKEFYHIGATNNVWPTHLPSFQPDMEALYTTLSEHSNVIADVISESLGEPKTLLSNLMTGGDTLMRALHYPKPLSQEENNPPMIWAAAHTDIGLFTILPYSTAAGLQVKTKSGEWFDVIIPNNAFLVNAGDMLQNLTNGEYRSSLHRVVNQGDAVERYSIVLFAHPTQQANLAPLPQSIARTGGQQLYPNATQKELLAERLIELNLASLECMRDLVQSGYLQRMADVGKSNPYVLDKLEQAALL